MINLKGSVILAPRGVKDKLDIEGIDYMDVSLTVENFANPLCACFVETQHEAEVVLELCIRNGLTETIAYIAGDKWMLLIGLSMGMQVYVRDAQLIEAWKEDHEKD